jgi:hypothetical protein
MTKKLNVDKITNELEGSVFFPGRTTEDQAAQFDSSRLPDAAASSPLPDAASPTQPETESTGDRADKSTGNRRRQARTSASNTASKLASTLAATPSSNADLIEAIRKTVKTAGKEVSFMRLTAHEKAQLSDIVYIYKRQGKKTSENEINRIAVNFLLTDYKENGAASVLAQVIEALRA